MKFTMKQFNDRFPTSDACLEELKQLRFANFTCDVCGRENMLSKVTGRQTYACPCGKQVYPLSGTIFHKSSTDLRTWFLVMFMMTTTRSGVSAKAVERMTGVTYKTAWRMMKEIRSLMDDNEDGDMLTGVVEIDESYVGGVRKGKFGREAANLKHTVMGMVEREGRVRTVVVPNDKAQNLLPEVQKHISKSAIVMSDQLRTYDTLGRMG